MNPMEESEELAQAQADAEAYAAKFNARSDEFAALADKLAALSKLPGTEAQIFSVQAEWSRITISLFHDREIGFDLAGVQAADEYIQRATVPEEPYPQTMTGFYYFLGECLIRCFGGKWVFVANLWVVSVPNAGRANPYAWIRKRFNDPFGQDSLVGKFLYIQGELDKNLKSNS